MFEVIPAIDILDGKVVRLYKGDYGKVSVYEGSPLIWASRFKDAGYSWVHIVNLSGAKDGEIESISEWVKKISAIGVKIEVGGGVRKISDIEKLFEWGASRVIIGTMAFKDKEFLKQVVKLWQNKTVVSMDVLDDDVMIRGWLQKAMRVEDAITFLNDSGAGWILCTDIKRDGALTGVNLKLYERICGLFNGNVIASGGVSSMQDIKLLRQLADNFSNLCGVVVGRWFYESGMYANEIGGCD